MKNIESYKPAELYQNHSDHNGAVINVEKLRGYLPKILHDAKIYKDSKMNIMLGDRADDKPLMLEWGMFNVILLAIAVLSKQYLKQPKDDEDAYSHEEYSPETSRCHTPSRHSPVEGVLTSTLTATGREKPDDASNNYGYHYNPNPHICPASFKSFYSLWRNVTTKIRESAPLWREKS